MDEDTLVMMIPLFGILLVMLVVWTRHQQKMAELGRKEPPTYVRHSGHTEELEERLQVVERIVTDPGYQVASQIEALRDRRQAADTAARAKETND